MCETKIIGCVRIWTLDGIPFIPVPSLFPTSLCTLLPNHYLISRIIRIHPRHRARPLRRPILQPLTTLLHDPQPTARAQPRCTRLQHAHRGIQIANAAAGLDLHLPAAHGRAAVGGRLGGQILSRRDHELHVFELRAGAVEARRRLDEVQVRGSRQVRRCENLRLRELRRLEDQLDNRRRRAQRADRGKFLVDGTVVGDSSRGGVAAVGFRVGPGETVGCGVAVLRSGRGGGRRGASKDAVVQDEVELGGAGGDTGTGFFQLGKGVLGAFVEADDSGDEDVGAF